MIFKAILDIFLTPLYALIGILPPFSLNFAFIEDYKSLLVTIFGLAGYFLPISALFPIIVINITIDIFTIIISIVVRIKSFVPLMPGG